MDDGLWSMVTAAGNMEKGVLVLLALCSIALWSMVFLKVPEVLAARRNGARFLAAFNAAQDFGSVTSIGPPACNCVQYHVFKSAIAALSGKVPPAVTAAAARDPRQFRTTPEQSTEELVLLTMQHTAAEYFAHLSRGLSFMATIGSTTPFIGLFGTVVGIMTTFYDLGGTKNPNMQVVAPGISGALVATAAGLAVAIPAVVACNYFLAHIDRLREGSDAFIERVMAIIRANTQTPKLAPKPAVVAPPPKPKPAAPVQHKVPKPPEAVPDEEVAKEARP